MAMATSWVMVLWALLAGQSGNELLDYVDTASYWRVKQVEPDAAKLRAELRPVAAQDVKALVEQLGSPTYAKRAEAQEKIRAVGAAAIPSLKAAQNAPNPEVAQSVAGLIAEIETGDVALGVRKLMAIRTLGETKAADALPELRALVDSTEPFVADYAKAAIAEIEGKPAARATIAADKRLADVWLLPKDAAAVAQLTPQPPTKRLDVMKLVESMPLPPNQSRQQQVDEVTAMLVSALDRVGNVRIDSITMGLSGEIGNRAGYAAFVVRGRWSKSALDKVVGEHQKEAILVGGVPVAVMDDSAQVAVVDDTTLVFIGGASRETIPTQALVAALKHGEGELRQNADMARLVGRAATDAPLWAAVTVTPTYREAPPLAPFNTLLISARPLAGDAQKLSLAVDAAGDDEKQIAATVKETQAQIEQAIPQIRQVAAMLPPAKMALDFMESLKLASDGKTATLRGELPGNLAFAAVGLFGVAPQPQPAQIQGPAAADQAEPAVPATQPK
jgi:hypothetical protein